MEKQGDKMIINKKYFYLRQNDCFDTYLSEYDEKGNVKRTSLSTFDEENLAMAYVDYMNDNLEKLAYEANWGTT